MAITCHFGLRTHRCHYRYQHRRMTHHPTRGNVMRCRERDQDRVRALFDHFDTNFDGHLSYAELRRLQLETAGDELEGPTYYALCGSLKCNPKLGVTLEALRAIYENEDGTADVDSDYEKIFSSGANAINSTAENVTKELVGDDEYESVFSELVTKKDKDAGKSSCPDGDEPSSTEESATSSSHEQQTTSHTTCTTTANIDAASKIRALHKHFDADRDRHLNYSEVSALQLATSNEILEGTDYCHICREHNCDPRKGLSFKALQNLYMDISGAELDGDYDKVFGAVKNRNELSNSSAAAANVLQKPYMLSFPEMDIPSLTWPTVLSPTQISHKLFGTSGIAVPETKKVDEDNKDHIESGDDDISDREVSVIAPQSTQYPEVEVDDKVRALHRFFDADGDDRLDYCELRNLQLLTSGDDIDPEEYRLVCYELGADPREGLTLGALQRTYSSSTGANIREDYKKVFPSESVGEFFASPRIGSSADRSINLRGDYPYLAAERLDKISLLFDYFDSNSDGFLSYQELRQLQQDTSGEDMDGVQYMSVCQMYDCNPKEGLKLEHLRELYSSQGTGSSLDEDYRKVFRKYVWAAPPVRKRDKAGAGSRDATNA